MTGLCLTIMSHLIVPTYLAKASPGGHEEDYRQSLSFNKLPKKNVK